MRWTISQTIVLDNNGSWMIKSFMARTQFRDGSQIIYRVLI